MSKSRRISDYQQQEKNHNQGSVYGDTLLGNSIGRMGLGRSILVSADNVIIAGNHVTAKANAMGVDKVIEVETDGDTLVVVKRTDIQSGTKAFYEAALLDNYTQKSNFVEDADVVEAICEQYQIEPSEVGYFPSDDEDEQDNPPEGFSVTEANVTVYYQSEADRKSLLNFLKQYGFKYELNS